MPPSSPQGRVYGELAREVVSPEPLNRQALPSGPLSLLLVCDSMVAGKIGLGPFGLGRNGGIFQPGACRLALVAHDPLVDIELIVGVDLAQVEESGRSE